MMNNTLLLQSLTQSPIGFCIVDQDDLVISSASPSFSSILTINNDIIGKSLRTFLPSVFVDFVFGQKADHIEREMTVRPMKGDGLRWVKMMAEKMEHEGKPHYAIWLIDITKDKMVEACYKEAIEDAGALAEMKSNLLATMSHEIRTPMQAVYGFMEMIGEYSKDNKIISDMVDSAKTSASGLLEILDDVLDLAKLDADKMELDSFEVPVRTLARGTIEAISARSHVNISLIDDIAQDVPFVVKGDPKRLRQILLNLLTNAVKFTKHGFVTLRINTNIKHINLDKADVEGEEIVGLRFEVIDTGLGMSKEVCDRLFKPFTQADNSTTRQYGGTGLGLSICKKLAELMGGQIGVMSEPGVGSTFWFEIPTVPVGTNQSSVELPDLEGLAVLVVEDHPMGKKEITNSLRSMGAKVEACESYQEGLELVKRRPFDVGVIDQGLPDGLGIDLMKEIAEMRPSMGLLMYTVRDDYGLQHTIRSMGATYLSKPASRVGLGEAVKGAAVKEALVELRASNRLLIAEDNESVRDILSRQLAMIGVDFTFAENGQIAYDKMQSEEFGLLISDLHMPELDGYGLISKIRADEEKAGIEDQEHFPVIVLTADVQMAQRNAYLSEGFDECLLKPVSLGQLRQLLVRWGIVREDDAIAALDGKREAHHQAAQNAKIKGSLSGETSSIDLKAMENQMGAVNADSVGMLGMFAELTMPLIEEIRANFEAGEPKALEESAHSLKGSARSACCMILGNYASDLQDRARNIEECAELVENIEQEFEKIQAEILLLQAQYS